jgi:DNA-binding CsgD family transcriptional regulator
MDDIRAVMDATGCERAPLLGVSEGGALSLLFASAHPERVASLTLYGSFAKKLADEDYPWGVSRDRLDAFMDSFDEAALSRREREIVQLAADGQTTPEIARRLFLSKRTIETHLAHAYMKLGVHSRLELVRRAAEFDFTVPRNT